MWTHQCCSNSSSDSCLGGGWVEVENPSGVQVIDCMTQEKWHTCVDNLDIKGYYDTCIGNIKDTYYEDMKMWRTLAPTRRLAARATLLLIWGSPAGQTWPIITFTISFPVTWGKTSIEEKNLLTNHLTPPPLFQTSKVKNNVLDVWQKFWWW